MRFLSKLFGLLYLVAAASLPSSIHAQQAGGRVVLVLPFDNRSGNNSLSWIGDSFPDTLNKRITSAGFLTISHDDRAFAFDHLGLPADFKPSRATTIRIAQQLDANYVIVGSYSVQSTGPVAQPTDRIDVQAQVLSVDDLRLSPPIQDSAELSHLFDAENSIAWKLAKSLDPRFNVALQTFLAAPGTVPLPAFENYIRGSNAPTDAERVQRLKAAIVITPDYAAALLALGKQQYIDRDYTAAAATLAKAPKGDRVALEANFYLGLARFNNANYAGAEQAFAFVASRLPLPEVVNDQGVAMSRQNKDATPLYQKASTADPSDEDYHYNLALAFFRHGDTDAAIRETNAALKLKPTDNEAVDLRTHLNAVSSGTKLTPNSSGNFAPVERIRRTYSEAGFRQAAFQLDQMRAVRMALLPPAQQASEYSQAGRDYLAEGLLPEAENEFQSALSADPNSSEAHTGMAQIREASGNAGQARDEALASLKLKPNAPAWLVLARLDLADNQLAVSASDVSQALHLEPNNPVAIALRMTLAQKGQAVQ